MTKYFKTIFALLLAIAGTIIILYQQNFITKDANSKLKIETYLQNLQKDLIDLKYAILKDEYFLYFDNDLVLQDIKAIDNELDLLTSIKHLSQPKHKYTKQKITLIQKRFKVLKKRVYNFLTLNASIKNSAIYIPQLFQKAYQIFDLNKPEQKNAVLLLAKISSLVSISKNSLDTTFLTQLKNIKKSLSKIESSINDPKKQAILQIADAHLNIFINYFTLFVSNINLIINSNIETLTKQTLQNFAKETQKSQKDIYKLSIILFIFFIFSILLVLYFIYKSEKDNILLKKLYDKLRLAYTFDALTGLKNRQAYKGDKSSFKHPALILANIDNFKRINEFYGVAIGDKILQKVAKYLGKIISHQEYKINLYRIGGDDFGLLFEFKGDKHLYTFAKEILSFFDKQTFDIEDAYIDISISIGASKEKRLLESADIALKYVKKSTRKRFGIYNNELDTSKELEKNIKQLRELKKAINKNNIIAYFQPIFDSNDNIVKYEVLARLKKSNGEILTPFYFLNAAKEAKLSSKITYTMLKQAFEVIKSSQIPLSVNISASDITDENSQKQILNLLKANKSLAKYITFEILESEEIKDFDDVKNFVNIIKSYKCSISIDDFGSGYSNFEELYKIKVDVLKIDGTLIKNVDKDIHARHIIKAIVNFAKSSHISTIAEFVHSKEVLQTVKALGIDYTQGFYLGEPSPELKN